MKILLFKVGQVAQIVDIDNDLIAMQKAVGGNLEVVTLKKYSDDESIVLVCNEDGKNLNLSLNGYLINNKGVLSDVIVGDFFIVKIFESEMADIVDEDIAIAMQYIAR